MVSRRITLSVQMVAIVMAMAVAGCDHITGVRVDIHAKQPIDDACISRSRDYMGTVSQFGRVPLDPKIKGELYMVQRDDAHVEVTRNDDSRQTISLLFSWTGPPTKEEEKESVRLINDVERAVLTACALNSETARIARTCEGRRLCREAGIRK